MASADRLWGGADFFKGFLPSRFRFRQLSFVVLAYEKNESYFGDTSRQHSTGSQCSESTHPDSDAPFPSPFLFHPDQRHTSRTPSVPVTATELRDPNSSHLLSTPPANTPVEVHEENDDAIVECESRHLLNSPLTSEKNSIQFFLFLRRDVQEPHSKYVGAPDTIQRCFFMCTRKKCSCQRLHVKEDAWRIPLDTLSQSSELVCFNEFCITRLNEADVLPTAGYYYALGLRHLGLTILFPRLCPNGESCECKEFCLSIHLAGPSRIPAVVFKASTPLMSLLPDSATNVVLSNLLQERSLKTVGDIQLLSNEAFEALAEEVPKDVLEGLLSVSICRFFEPQSALLQVVSTFPHIQTEMVLPQLASFPLVSDVLKLTPSQLYARPLPSVLTNVFEIIRERLKSTAPFHCIAVEDVDSKGFIILALSKIKRTAASFAHNSWRRHDFARPVVTCMITFVDVRQCECGLHPEAERSITSDIPLTYDGQEGKARLPAPYGSWCECPRMWEVAVNYELNTPMGSRCSEQNAMGAIARCGAPTWALREVVVHGNRPGTEMNPLFPCGVCENMLRKVDKDVRENYGKTLVLWMFDATSPTKVFSLPIQEISLRDNPRFMELMGSQKR